MSWRDSVELVGDSQASGPAGWRANVEAVDESGGYEGGGSMVTKGADSGSWEDDNPMAEAIPVHKKEPTPTDIFKGAGETIMTFITGATGGTLGQVGGTIKGAIDVAMDPELDYGTQEAATHIRDTADQYGGALTYEPRTETGREYVETIGEAMGPLEAIEPMVAGGAMTGVGRRGANARRGNATRAFDDPQKNVSASDRIAYDDRGVPMHVTNDAQSRTAMARLGIPPEMMNQFKYASPETRQAMIEMIERGQARMNDSELPNARSVMGEYIGGRASLAQTAMKKHGADIDSAAMSRQGTNVQTADINSKYNTLLEKQRVKVNDDGTLNFDGSAIPDESRAKLQEIHTRMSKYGKDGVGDFDELHKYKQYLSDIASYDKQATGGSAGVQKIVKGLREQINDTLGSNAPEYKTANAGYAEIVAPMRKVLKKAGDDVSDLTDAEVAERFALQARGMTNNTQGGIDLKATMNAINDAIKNNADMFTPEELRAAGLSGKGDVNVNLQKMADLGAFTDRHMPDKPTGFGVLTSDAAKSGMPTKGGVLEDLWQVTKNTARGGEEAVAVKDAAKRAEQLQIGMDNLLGVLGRKY